MSPRRVGGRRWLLAACLSVAAAALLLWVRGAGPLELPVEDGQRGEGAGPILEGVPRSNLGSGGSATVPSVEALRWASGRVLDPRLAPAEGVEVVALAGDGARLGVARSDAAGRFRILLGPRAAETQRVTLDAARAAQRGVLTVALEPAGPAELDVGSLLLRSTRDVRVLVHEDGRPSAGAAVLFACERLDTPVGRTGVSAWEGWSAPVHADEDGRVLLQAVPDGALRLHGESPAGATGEVFVPAHPATAGDASSVPSATILALRSGRHVRILVRRAGTHEPMAGVRLPLFDADGWQVWLPHPLAVTGADGWAQVGPLPLADVFHVLAVTSAGVWPYGAHAPGRIAPGATELVIEVPEGTVYRWSIGSGDGGPPSDGTPVPVRILGASGWPDAAALGAPDGTVEEGAVVLRLLQPMHQRLVAVLADGRRATLSLVAQGDGTWRTPEVRFRWPRTLTVRVREDGMRPALGLPVLAFTTEGRRAAGPADTDAEGVATFTELPAVPLQVRVGRHPGLVEVGRAGVFDRASAADVDLTERDGRVELSVPAPQRFTVRVVDPEGRPFEQPVSIFVGVLPQSLVLVTPEDLAPAGPGAWRFDVRPPTPGTRLVATVYAEGFASEERIVLRDGGADSGGWATTITLRPAGALLTRIEPPADGAYDVRLEHREVDVWVPILRLPREQLQAGAAFPVEGLRAGTYRLRDALSGAVSSELALVLGAGPPTLALDISKAGPCEGTLVLPAGVDAEEVRVEVTGTGVAFDDVRHSAGDGPPRWLRGTSWTVRHPGQGAITVAALHPRCETADGEGRLVLTGPAQGLVLRLRPKR